LKLARVNVPAITHKYLFGMGTPKLPVIIMLWHGTKRKVGFGKPTVVEYFGKWIIQFYVSENRRKLRFLREVWLISPEENRRFVFLGNRGDELKELDGWHEKMQVAHLVAVQF
jgi:hypothetical protein